MAAGQDVFGAARDVAGGYICAAALFNIEDVHVVRNYGLAASTAYEGADVVINRRI